MTVIQVLYLPRDDRLRTIVRTVLDFIEEVYKDEYLSDLKFVSYDPDDSIDMTQALYNAVIKGVKPVPMPTQLYWPHYEVEYACAWVPIFREQEISDLLSNVAHEVTHHVLEKLPVEDNVVLAMALTGDLGVDVDELTRRHGVPFRLARDVATAVHETTTIYITYNYFAILKREPETPTPQSNIKNFALNRYHDIIMRPPRPKVLADVLRKIYFTMAYDDLPNYRRTVHRMFVKMIKKFPVDVLESNRAKYGILYSGERVTR